jgi:hypothetical protein
MQLTLTHSGVFYLADGCTQLLQRIVKSTGAHSYLVEHIGRRRVKPSHVFVASQQIRLYADATQTLQLTVRRDTGAGFVGGLR